MSRAVTKVGKTSKKVAHATTKKVAKRKPVVIPRPTSPKRTEKTFGMGAQRSRDIEALVDKVVA
jgi:hypothetical protein